MEVSSSSMIRPRPWLLSLLLPVAALAGLYVPTSALLVNEAKPLDVDSKRNGFIAHVCDSGFNVGLMVDLVRVSDQEKYRIVLDPKIDRPVPLGKPPRLPTSVVFQQIPPGVYLATKLSLGDREPVRFGPDTLVVKAGQILSLGRIRANADLDFLGMLDQVRIATWSDTIEARIRAVHVGGLDTLPIFSKSIQWIIRKN